MTRRCKHENVTGRSWSSAYPRWYAEFKSHRDDWQADAIVCDSCGAWLPLDESDETPERIAIEIRAAHLAAEWDDDADWDGFVSLGMCSPEGEHGPLIEADIAAGRKFPRDLSDYLAGHLARVIATHGEGE